MTDYSDLVKRLRGKKLNCTCAAKSRSECCCNTDWPESSCNEAADAIEALEAQLETADNTSIAMRDMLIEKLDTRIAELEAALKLMIDTQDDWEKGVSEVVGKQPDVFNRAIDAARNVFGDKE